MARGGSLLIAVALMCGGLIAWMRMRSEGRAHAALQQRLVGVEAERAQLRIQLSAASASPASAPSVSVAASDSALLALHSRWEWRPMVREMLSPFGTITRQMLDTAVERCFNNGTMYCLRAQVVGGRLYINDYRAIFFDRHYAPARVMPLLELLRNHRWGPFPQGIHELVCLYSAQDINYN